MSGTDFMIEQAEARVAIETGHKVEAVSGLLSQPGLKVCADCDEPISEARRLAAPFARRCFECQSARENIHP
jgi:phage/conjugal plasmid C-4 type zinc finger TraR family protein